MVIGALPGLAVSKIARPAVASASPAAALTLVARATPVARAVAAEAVKVVQEQKPIVVAPVVASRPSIVTAPRKPDTRGVDLRQNVPPRTAAPAPPAAPAFPTRRPGPGSPPPAPAVIDVAAYSEPVRSPDDFVYAAPATRPGMPGFGSGGGGEEVSYEEAFVQPAFASSPEDKTPWALIAAGVGAIVVVGVGVLALRRRR